MTAPNHDALREALARRDKAVEPCPYMKPCPPSLDKLCAECGADASEPCRKRVLADADFVTSARAHLPSLLGEIAALRERVGVLEQSVISFGAPWAVQYADTLGLPCGHIHPRHYDILADAGARMDSFTRAVLTGAAS